MHPNRSLSPFHHKSHSVPSFPTRDLFEVLYCPPSDDLLSESSESETDCNGTDFDESIRKMVAERINKPSKLSQFLMFSVIVLVTVFLNWLSEIM